MVYPRKNRRKSFSFLPRGKDSGEIEFYCSKHKIKPGTALFTKPMKTIEEIHHVLNPSYIYHGEALQRKMHNTITYERLVPFFVIIYDIQDTDQNGKFLTPQECEKECKLCGLEYLVPLFDNVTQDTRQDPHQLAAKYVTQVENGQLMSVLGENTPPEGVVLKCHEFIDMKRMARSAKFKYVTKRFKEMNHSKKPKSQELTPSQYFGQLFVTEARKTKALQHLVQRGVLEKNITQEVYEKELDADLLKERSKLIYNYLAAEFTPMVCQLQRAKELNQTHTKWNRLHDDTVFQALASIPITTAPHQKSATMMSENGFIKDFIFTQCLLHVLKASRSAL